MNNHKFLDEYLNNIEYDSAHNDMSRILLKQYIKYFYASYNTYLDSIKEKNTIKAFSVGTNLILNKDEKLTGIVRSVILGKDSVKYEVSYWVGSSHHVGIFNEEEVQPVKNETKLRIGFNNNEVDNLV